MAKIVKFVPMVSGVPVTRANTGYATPNYSNPWTYTAGNYDGTVAVYFEAIIRISAGTPGTAYAELRNITDGSSVTDSEISTANTTETRVRSGDIVANLTTAKQYQIRIKSSSGSVTCEVQAARLIIVQTGTITKTETIIELGSNKIASDTSFTQDANKGFWKYVASEWDGTITAFYEGLIGIANADSTATSRLGTASESTIAGSEITGSTLSEVSARSGDFFSSLVDGTAYQPYNKTSNGARSYRLRVCRIIIVQTGMNKTTSYYAGSYIVVSSIAQATYSEVYWDSDEWSVNAASYKLYGTAYNIGGAGGNTLIDLNDGSSDAITLTINSGSNVPTYGESSTFTPVDNTAYKFQLTSGNANQSFGICIGLKIVVTVASSDLVITPAAITAKAASVAPTVVHGSISITPTARAAVAVSVNPTVVITGPFITPTASTAATSTVNPTVIHGSITITPAASSSAAASASPTVVVTGPFITPSAATAATASVNPTVILGSITVTPGAATSPAVSINPTVILGSVTVQPSASYSIAVSVNPTVVIAGPYITPSALTAATSVNGPTVVIIGPFITPLAVTAVVVSINPTVILGSITIVPGAAVSPAVSVAPTVVLGSVAIQPGASSVVAASVSPTVSITGPYITPSAASAAAISQAPTVVITGPFITPSAATAATTSINPTVIHGSITITPSATTAATSVAGPTVTGGGGTNVTPAPATVVVVSVSPTVILGSVTVSGLISSAATDTRVVVIQSSITYTPEVIFARAASIDPAVIHGSITLTPQVGSSVSVSVSPTIVLGSVTVAPSAGGVRAVSVSPTVVLGSITVTPSAVDGSAISVDPTVILGSIAIVPGSIFARTVSLVGGIDLGGHVTVTPDPATARTYTTFAGFLWSNVLEWNIEIHQVLEKSVTIQLSPLNYDVEIHTELDFRIDV